MNQFLCDTQQWTIVKNQNCEEKKITNLKYKTSKQSEKTKWQKKPSLEAWASLRSHLKTFSKFYRYFLNSSENFVHGKI